MKTKKYMFLALAMLFALSGCKDEPSYGDSVFVTGTLNTNTVRFAVEDVSSLGLTVSSSAKASADVNVDMATAQCATASIITLFLCPFITAAFDKWMQKKQKGIYSPEGWAYDQVKAN